MYRKRTNFIFSRLGRDISVYSGTHGVLEFPDVNNNHQQIYLYNKTYIPAPLYYWKVIQDKVKTHIGESSAGCLSQISAFHRLEGILKFLALKIILNTWIYFHFYKFQITKTAAAFIGLNDPHETSIPLELCTNR